MTAARINARLDAATAKKLDVLRRRTGLSTTEIVRAALERFYESESRPAETAAEILRQTGFIGSAEGPRDLSSTYKERLSESLGKKHG